MIVAVPPVSMEGVFHAIAPHLAEGAVVTDTASTKGHVLRWAEGQQASGRKRHRVTNQRAPELCGLSRTTRARGEACQGFKTPPPP